jgi:hypothetical protein
MSSESTDIETLAKMLDLEELLHGLMGKLLDLSDNQSHVFVEIIKTRIYISRKNLVFSEENVSDLKSKVANLNF